MVQGERAFSALASGIAGSFGASAWGKIGGFANQGIGQIIFGAISGRIGAELTGGNFWQGAAIGGIVAGLNHAMQHGIENMTKKFNEQLAKTKSAFEKIRDKYTERMKVLAEMGARPEAYIAAYQESLYEFVKLVKTNGKYDLKSNPKSDFNNKKIGEGAYYKGEIFKAEDFGNYNFGVVAKAFGLSLNFSQAGAGLYQIYSGTSSIKWVKTYFDDPRDYKMIQRGYKHYKK